MSDLRAKKIWSCKIGEVDQTDLPDGMDNPMRRAVAAQYRAITGREPEFIFSGWGAELTEPERAVVENRLPDAALSGRDASAQEQETREQLAPGATIVHLPKSDQEIATITLRYDDYLTQQAEIAAYRAQQKEL